MRHSDSDKALMITGPATALLGVCLLSACFLVPSDPLPGTGASADPDDFDFEIELVPDADDAPDDASLAAAPPGAAGGARGRSLERVDRSIPLRVTGQDQDGLRFDIDENELVGLLPHERVAFRGVYLTRGRVVDLDLRRLNLVDDSIGVYLSKDNADPGILQKTFTGKGGGTKAFETKIIGVKKPGNYYWKAVITAAGEPTSMTTNNVTLGNAVKVKKKKKKKK